jgi:uncharacterized protein (DUF1501 family)
MSRKTDANDRRDFLKRFAGTLAGGTALSLFPQLKLIESAIAADVGNAPAAGAYRALVCVYMGGGSDSFNLLVPSDSARYAIYNTARGGVFNGTNGPLALDQAALLPISLNGLSSGQSYGLHPACADWTAVDRNGVQTATMPGLQSLTNQGKVAWVANVGTLVVPTTKANYGLITTAKPPQLFSHSDQTNVWFQGRSQANFNRGWGGQVADLLAGQNTPIGSTGVTLPLGISFSGSNRFQVGVSAVPYQMGACGNPNSGNALATGGGNFVGTNFANCSGATRLSNFRGCATAGLNANEAALCSLLAAPQPQLMSAEHASITSRSLNLAAQLDTLVASATNGALQLNTPFRALADDQIVAGVNAAADGGNGLAEQLAVVARLIKARAGLGQSRNVFFVSLGGFDTHATQMSDNTQPRLLRRLSRALGAFYKSLEELGMENNVTTFTMSEFGRTLNSNGDGSDHGWGSVSLVMGGAVNNGGTAGNGGRFVGEFPDQTLNGANSFSRGQMIPTTSADSVASTLASWMGVTPANLQTIFPHLANFTAGTPYNLGFMNPAPV